MSRLGGRSSSRQQSSVFSSGGAGGRPVTSRISSSSRVSRSSRASASASKLLAVLGQEPPRLVVARVDDPDHLFIYGAGGLLTIGSFSAVTARSTQVRVLRGASFYRPQLLAHPPAGDHPTREVGGRSMSLSAPVVLVP